MKQIGGLFDQLWLRDNLVQAAYAAAKEKRARPHVRLFFGDLDRHLAAIGRQLRHGKYRFSPYTSFSVQDTKTRIIHAPSFQDRVVHHAIIAITGQTFERGALEHSYACRTGRGQHAALRQALAWTRRTDYYGKMDVSKFYDSVDHGVLRRLLRRRFRERRLLDLFDQLLASYCVAPGNGLPIGALTSQYLGNFYLDEFDRRLKAGGHARRYLRYMDDAVVWGTPETIAAVRNDAGVVFDGLKLTMKNGGEWNRCSRGLPFLGFVVYPDRLRLGKAGRKRLRRKWHRLERCRETGGISEADLQRRGEALFAHACVGDDVGWRRALCGFSRYDHKANLCGEALEPSTRNPGRGLEQFRQELPLRQPQQEQARQPQQECGLPSLSGSRHEGRWPPDDAPSRSRRRIYLDESAGKSPSAPDIQSEDAESSYVRAENGAVGAPFIDSAYCRESDG